MQKLHITPLFLHITLKHECSDIHCSIVLLALKKNHNFLINYRFCSNLFWLICLIFQLLLKVGYFWSGLVLLLPQSTKVFKWGCESWYGWMSACKITPGCGLLHRELTVSLHCVRVSLHESDDRGDTSNICKGHYSLGSYVYVLLNFKTFIFME